MEIQITDDMAGVRDYLALMVEIRKRFGTAKPDMPYWCLEDFLLQHGTEFGPPAKRPRGERLGRIKQCFKNAADRVLFSGGRYTYVEGVALGAFFPVLHAWVVRGDGVMIDPTWRTPGAAYIGVPVREEYLRRVLVANETYGPVLEDWAQGHPLLSGKVKPEEALLAPAEYPWA